MFKNVEVGPPIEVFALNKAFIEDNFAEKCNLGVGAYRTDAGKPWVLPVVRDAEIKIAAELTPNHEYLPVLGLETFTSAATALLLGPNSLPLNEGRACGIQSISGTGALTIGAAFLARILGKTTFLYSKPTWENHRKLFLNAGFTEPLEYRYWNPETRGVDIEGMLEDIRNAPEGSVVILHACAHNPTGCDPNKEQWEAIANLIQEKNHFTFFDAAYQGFASGDPDNDAWPVRYFVARGFELFAAQSFAKNFGLYNERIGNLTVVSATREVLIPFKSQMSLIIRAMYSNPPNHGAQVVSLVLNDKDLREKWLECVQIMASRILSMRKALKDHLIKLDTPGNWDHITSQIGMFSYTGLNEAQVAHLIKKHHVYLLQSGRINMCGVTTNNVDYIARAIYDAVTTVQ